MKIVYLLSAVLALSMGSAQAQVGFGGEIGFNAAKYRLKNTVGSTDVDLRFGMRAGAFADLAINDNFYFQPGLYYVSNGFKKKFGGGYAEYGINTIEIPVNIEYKFGMLGYNRLFAGAGPFLGLNMNGYVKSKVPPSLIDSKRDLNMGKDIVDDIRRIDFGLGANVGYQLTAGLMFRARGQFGLLNLQPVPGSAKNLIHSFSFGVTAAYVFYRKDKQGVLIIHRERDVQKQVEKAKKRNSRKWHEEGQ